MSPSLDRPDRSFVIILAAGGAKRGKKRVALVIGNADYRHAQKLAKPINDARAVKSILETLGFTAQIFNQTLDGMLRAFSAFSDNAADADIAAVYYAGHGLEVHGKNYLVPIDAQLENPRSIAEIEYKVYKLSDILDNIAGARSLQLVILDCCRVDPFGDVTRSLRGITRGCRRSIAASHLQRERSPTAWSPSRLNPAAWPMTAKKTTPTVRMSRRC